MRSLALLLLALAGTQPVPVRATSADEQGPAAGGGYIAWTQAKDVYAQRGSGRPFRVNPPGTHAQTGGIDGTRLVYQEIRGGRSDVKLYDLASGERGAPPAGVNTSQWEWRPTISGRWLLFGRIDEVHGIHRVLLRNLVTGREVVLAAAGGHRPYAAPGQVNGDYAVWTTCGDAFCNVYRYDIAAGTTTKIPNSAPYRHPQYGASVSRAGTVYFGRSSPSCGDTRLMRYTKGGATSVLFTFPAGKGFQFSYAAAGQVFFDIGDCRVRSLDIYKIRDRE